MQTVVLVLLSFILIRGYYSKFATGVALKHRRIINGNVVNIKNFPYMAGLVVKLKKEKGRTPLAKEGFAGGASIIADHWVITAGHCIAAISNYNLIEKGAAFVRSNTTYWSSHVGNNNYQDHKIELAVIHPLYNATMTDYDVGVIKVAEKFTAVFEKPIKLAGRNYAYNSGTETTVLGWGTTVADVEPFTVPELRAVIVKLIDSHACTQAYSEVDKVITPRMICAGAPGKDACINDSGGPLADGNLLIGVVSWGVGCAIDKLPGVYTHIGIVSNWIRETMRKN